MHTLWDIARTAALVVLCVNAGLYLLRAHRLRTLPARDAVDRLGVFHAASAFVAESIALAAVVLSIPLGWPLPRRGPRGGGRAPVILVHGVGPTAGAWWCLRRRLRRDGWTPVTCPRQPTFLFDVERAAEALRRAIHDASNGAPLTLIGHGAGGLVIRYCLRRYPAPRVRRVVTLGTPHRGTELARCGPLRNTLAPGAPLLNKLNAVDRVPQQFDVIAIHSTFDAVVLPPTGARYPGAFNIRVNDVGHTALLYSSKVYQLIAENLAAAPPRP